MRGYGKLLAGLLIVSFILQTSAVPFLQVAHVWPDLPTVLVVLVALVFGPREAAYVGLAAGLLQDLLLGRYIGLFTVGKLAVAALAGFVSKKVYMEHVLTPVVTAFITTVVQRTAMVVVLGLGGVGRFELDWGRPFWAAAGFNAVLAGALFGLLVRLKRRFSEGPRPVGQVRAPWF